MKTILKLCIIIFFIFLGCTENKNDEETILEKIALAYIDAHEEDMASTESSRKEKGLSKVPIVTDVNQRENYRGYKMFFITYEVGVARYDMEREEPEVNAFAGEWEYPEERMPSKLIKAGNNRYIAMYIDNKAQIPKASIPAHVFLRDWGQIIVEDSWIVLMCEECNNFIVVDDRMMPHELIVQLENFTCDCSSKKKSQSIKIDVEYAIMDTTKELVVPSAPE